jgi:hypothetical protein
VSQQILVALIVLAAAVFAVWKLMPARRRLQLLVSLDAWAARRAGLAAWRKSFLAPRIQRAAGAGCAGCAANVRGPQAPARK